MSVRRDDRLEIRLPAALKARVESQAALSGQTVTVFVERALAAALDGPRERPLAFQQPTRPEFRRGSPSNSLRNFS